MGFGRIITGDHVVWTQSGTCSPRRCKIGKICSRTLLRQGGTILLSGRMGGLTLVRAPAWLLIRRRPDLDLRASDERNTISPAIVADELHVLEMRMEVMASFALPTAEHLPGLDAIEH